MSDASATKVKKLLRVPDDRVAPDELVAGQVSVALDATGPDKLPSSGAVDAEAIRVRVDVCEKATGDFAGTVAPSPDGACRSETTPHAGLARAG